PARDGTGAGPGGIAPDGGPQAAALALLAGRALGQDRRRAARGDGDPGRGSLLSRAAAALLPLLVLLPSSAGARPSPTLQAGAAAAGHAYAAVIVSASHTHSGPGAYIDSEVFGALATDRFDAGVRRAVLDGILAAVERAERDKAPALVGAGTTAAPALTESRLDRPLDPEVALLKLVQIGRASCRERV